jgi:hypothetical protein
LGTPSYQRVILTLLHFATAYVGVFFSLVSYYLWNEAITLYTQKNGPDLLFNLFLVEYSYFFLNQAII